MWETLVAIWIGVLTAGFLIGMRLAIKARLNGDEEAAEEYGAGACGFAFIALVLIVVGSMLWG